MWTQETDFGPEFNLHAIAEIYNPRRGQQHFRLTSGLHSSGYLQCALVLQHPREAEACGVGIAGPVTRLSKKAVAGVIPHVIATADQVSMRLGYRPRAAG